MSLFRGCERVLEKMKWGKKNLKREHAKKKKKNLKGEHSKLGGHKNTLKAPNKGTTYAT
jgi:hypothetical protein